MVKLAVLDLYRGFEIESSPIVNAFGRHGAKLVDDPTCAELLFVSVFGKRHQALGGTKVAFSGETRYASSVHWTIDGRSLPQDTHLRLPLWALVQLTDKRELQSAEHSSRRFCNFIFSNPACEFRNRFFDLLNERLHVDALGAVRRNSVHPLLSERSDLLWSETKQLVLRDYRFTIAFENVEQDGYTTEKLIDAWLNDSIPIYWGNPSVFDEFPQDAMLSPYLSGSLEKLVDDVLEAHYNPSVYSRLQRANPYKTGIISQLVSQYERDLDIFAGRVVEDARAHAKARRTTYLQRALWRVDTALRHRWLDTH